MTLSCRHFGTCGGCSALNTPIAAQLAGKADRIRRRLDRHLGEVEIAVDVPAAPPRHYRTKLLYPVQPARAGRCELGIYRRGSHQLVRVRECAIQDPGLTALGSRAAAIFNDLGLRPYDERDGSGFVRALQLRLAPGSGELLIGVVTRPGVFDAGRALAEQLLEAAADLPNTGRRSRAVGVVRSIGDRSGNYLLGERQVPLLGRDYTVDRQDGLTWRISLASFYQVHRDASALLYLPALRMAGDVTGQRVVDGYGGIGTFGLRFAAAGAAQVVVVEDGADACRDAERNAKDNHCDNVVVQRSAFDVATFAAHPDLLVVDPPRAGLGRRGVARVLAAAPGRLLHVACNDAALARDLDGLAAGGYRVRQMRLCDLFPHTEHVEVVTLLSP